MNSQTRKNHWMQWIGFVLGPLVAAGCLVLLPTEYQAQSEQVSSEQTATAAVAAAEAPAQAGTQEFTWGGRATLAVMAWMGIWWLTEAIEISATALLPLVVFPLLDVADIKSAAAPYADHLIFLYFGGFVLALSMERWMLGKRIALLTLKLVGTSASQMVIGFMLVTAALSAFVSNTATTAMMLPIAMSTIALLKSQGNSSDSSDSDGETNHVDRFGTCLLLSIAYSASIGGIMTIIGTPPNAFLVGFLEKDIAEPYRVDFSFAGWLPIGASLVVVLLPLLYFLMTKLLFPIADVRLSGGREMLRTELLKLGAVRRGEWITLTVFCITICLWLTRPMLTNLSWSIGGTDVSPFAGLSDTGIAMSAALALFLIPVNLRERQFTMNWQMTNKMPWGILILFGGGLSLAKAVKDNGVAEFLGSFANQIGDLPVVLTVLLVTSAIVFLTELTSNVATTTSLVPVLAALAPGVGVHPLLLIVPATMGASCAFMLPVATPPNAIVFGSGEIELPQMVRAGFLLNLFSIVVITLLTFVVVRPWLQI